MIIASRSDVCFCREVWQCRQHGSGELEAVWWIRPHGRSQRLTPHRVNGRRRPQALHRLLSADPVNIVMDHGWPGQQHAALIGRATARVRHTRLVAWEWVAPVATAVVGTAGAYFTWLAGERGRKHAERMLTQQQEADERASLTQPRRDAYMAALKYIELDRRRQRYKLEDEQDKLAQIEKRWPKDERVEMLMDAVIGVRTYGSTDAQRFADEWRQAIDEGNDDALAAAACKIQEQVRRELNTDPGTDSQAGFTEPSPT